MFLFEVKCDFPFPKFVSQPIFSVVRIPIPFVLLLCLFLVAGLWWFGTRDADFLTPPSESELAEIRSKIQSSLPEGNQPADAVSAPHQPQDPAPPPPQPENPKTVIVRRDLNRPPTLDEYLSLASEGPAFLIDLATLLESEKQFQRALITWERVIDSTKPDVSQSNSSIAAIQRLRATLPNWNTDPTQAIPLTLHASTNSKTAKILKPILEETARDLERASAGILKITTSITTKTSKSTSSTHPPVALWLTGSSKNSKATEALSFKFNSSKSLPDDTRKTVFLIISEYLTKETKLSPPRAIGDATSPIAALNSHISRRSWQELGRKLNTPPPR